MYPNSIKSNLIHTIADTTTIMISGLQNCTLLKKCKQNTCYYLNHTYDQLNHFSEQNFALVAVQFSI